MLGTFASELIQVVVRARISEGLAKSKEFAVRLPQQQFQTKISVLEFFLNNKETHQSALVEQWIFMDRQSWLERFQQEECNSEKQPLCCVLQGSTLNKVFLQQRQKLKQLEIVHRVRHEEPQPLEGFTTVHMDSGEKIKIIYRFQKKISLESLLEEKVPLRTRSYTNQEVYVPEKELQRKHSEQLRKKSLKMMYAVSEDVTFLLEEEQAERMMSQNSDKDQEFIMQAIAEEDTDITEWQMIGKSEKEDRVAKQLKLLRMQGQRKATHSHQILRLGCFLAQFNKI